MVRTRNRTANEEQGTQTIIPPRDDAAASPTPAAATAAAPSGNTAPAQGTASSSGSSNAVAPVEQRALGGVNARNAFEAISQDLASTNITGTLIKFTKGDWITGDDEDLDEGMELVANMDNLMIGWTKWEDNKPTDKVMGLVSEGYRPPTRRSLGDNDQALWELDDQGRARDPWQSGFYMILKTPGEAAVDDELYTFATSSKGGKDMILELCGKYGKEMRVRPDMYPIVKLGADSYRHQEYGKTFVPLMQIVGWEPVARFADVSPTTAAEPEAEEPAEPAAAPRRSAGGRSRR
jgi:hypothetical protein